MVEGISLSGIMEVPVVVDLGMRPGPATGMPTWTEQGELRMVLHAGHGDFPRIVLAPGDAREAVELSAQAFNLAYRFQVPVFILTDKYLNENTWQVKKTVLTNGQPIEKEPLVTEAQTLAFKRYDLSASDGVSPRTIPGVEGGQYLSNSYEHDEEGWTTEEAGMRKSQVEKRMKKMKAIESVMPLPAVYGAADATITFVAFGSTKGPVLEAIQILEKKGTKAKLIHFSTVFPFAPGVKEMLTKEKKLISIEGNVTAQLAGLIRQETGIEMSQNFTKYDGRQWVPEEIIEKLASLPAGREA
jgi:2-oxoglutarate ferredoxin oxidoreductase subunit alpha